MRKTKRVSALTDHLEDAGLKTKKVLRVTLFSTAAVVLLGSCAGLHVFNTTQTPNLTAKGEGNANAYVGWDHAEFQAAYSPLNHFALMANSYYAFGLPYHESSGEGTNMAEAAIGYYHSLRNNTDKINKWYFDAFAGYGGGTRRYDGDSDLNIFDRWTVSSDYRKAFLQGSAYWKHKRVDVGIAVQGSWIYFDSFDLVCDYVPQYSYGRPLMNIALQNRSVYAINAALTYKYHVGKWALVMQVSGTQTDLADLPLHSPVPNVRMPYFNDRPLALTCGLEFDFGRAASY